MKNIYCNCEQCRTEAKESLVNKLTSDVFSEAFGNMDKQLMADACDCYQHETQVCDKCQGITGKEKDTVSNPKDIIGSNKIPVHMFPQAGVYMGALGNLDGALKYGRNNWRAAEIKYTVYLDALKRHADALLEGEDEDPDSGLHHLCHILATAGILADAYAFNKIVDDRNYGDSSLWRRFVTGITKHVIRLKAKHSDKNPRHWDISDNEVV